MLFENITINQRVEVRHNGKVLQGTVKFKGCLNGRNGEFVGILLAKRGKIIIRLLTATCSKTFIIFVKGDQK